MSYRDKIRLIAVREQLSIARMALRLIADRDGHNADITAETALDEIEQIELTRLGLPGDNGEAA